MAELKGICSNCENECTQENQCDVCGKILCDDCKKECADCDRILCEECAIECPECGGISCEDCVLTCSICGESYCSGCVGAAIGTCAQCEEVFCHKCGDVIDEDDIATDFGAESLCGNCYSRSRRRGHRRY